MEPPNEMEKSYKDFIKSKELKSINDGIFDFMGINDVYGGE